MAKVYIVTNGSYSDYGIRSVFLSREFADKFAELERRKSYRNNDTTVEEWDSDVAIDNRLGYIFSFDSSGKIDDTHSWVTDKFVFRDEETGMGTPEVDEFLGGVGRLRVNVNAESREEAIKIACDKRAEYLAKKHDI